LSREFNGEVLVEELGDLRNAQVPARHLADCVLALRDLDGAAVSEAQVLLKRLASNRFAGQPALGALLVRWQGRLKSTRDVGALVDHLKRLAVAMSLLAVVRRASERLPRGGRG
jgi:hypothetical protein